MKFGSKTFRSSITGVFLTLSLSGAVSEWTDQLMDFHYSESNSGLRNQIVVNIQQSEDPSEWRDALVEVALDGSATADGRRLAMRALRFCASLETANQLTPLLTDPALYSDALSLISLFPSSELDQALIQAAKTATGSNWKAIIAHLATRGSTEAVPDLIEMAQSTPSVTEYQFLLKALSAMGDESLLSFWNAMDAESLPLAIREASEQAMIRWLSESADSQSLTDEQITLAKQWLQITEVSTRRYALLQLLLQANPDDIQPLLNLLVSDQLEDQEIAAQNLPLVSFKESTWNAISGTWSVLPIASKELVIRVLTQEKEVGMLQIVRSQLERDESESLTLSCFEAVAAIGNLEDAKRMLQFMRSSESKYDEVAMETLMRIPDPACGEWVWNEFTSASSEMQAKLAEVMAERGLRRYLPDVFEMLSGLDSNARRSVYRMIGDLGDGEWAEKLMIRREQVEGAEVNSIERAVVDIGRRIPTNAVATDLIARWEAETEEAPKQRLLRMIGAIHRPVTLDLVASEILTETINPVAFRSLISWTEPDAIGVIDEFLNRPEVDPDLQKQAWAALFRLTKNAFEVWHEQRNEFWEICASHALNDDQFEAMIAFTLESERSEFVEWLESNIEHESLGKAFSEAAQTLRKRLEGF